MKKRIQLSLLRRLLEHFIPNFFIEVSKSNLDAKILGMESYEYEKRDYPHPRSPQALRLLAEYRGISIGRKFAEAFAIIRSII